LSSSSSASESSAARSPPPVELDFDHPVRHVQPAFFYPTPGAVAADYYVHTRRATGAGARAQDANHGLDADGSLYLDPEEDEECKRGIPVFKPTMEVSHPAVPCREPLLRLKSPLTRCPLC
jgi:hypothetical protein